MTGFLEEAAAAARSNVRRWKQKFPDPASMVRTTRAAFLPDGPGHCGVIAEVKRRSPSRGDLMGGMDPLRFPPLYEAGGAEAVSVVVEEQHFGGSPEVFEEVRGKTALPLLWKDFVVDPYQVQLASALGASAVLLIAGMLTDRDLAGFLEKAREEEIRALVEVHNGAELQRALAAGADLIGVNNRDLVTLEVDIEVSERLAEYFPQEVQRISESGVRSPEDVARLASLGYRAVLIGESLVTAGDTERLLREMVEAGKNVRA